MSSKSERQGKMENATRRQTHMSMAVAESVYKRFWQLITVKDSARCYCCTSPSTGRSAANAWGSIIDFPTCDAHHERYDGKWVDSVDQFKEAEAGANAR